MKSKSKSKDELLLQVEDLEMRLEEAEEILRAIRMGEVDALVVSGSDGDQIYTLKGATQPYRILVESMSEGALTLTADGTVYYCNKRFSEIVRTPPEKIIGSSVYGFVAQDDQERVRTILDQGREQGSRGETCLRAADGTLVPVHLSISPLRSDENIVVCAVITDLTEQKQHEKILASEAVLRGVKEELEIRVLERTADLERRNQELQEFAFVASHDLQEPLRMVSSFTQMLSMKYKDKLDDNAREYIQFAVEGTERMYAMINDLLAYSRIQTRVNEFKEVDMNHVMEYVKKILSIQIQQSKASVTYSNLPKIFADENQIIQLMQNLVSNAIKFSNNTPEVHISFKSDTDNNTFSVADNGIGIEPQYFENIFKIFQRLMPKEEYAGTGIGLAICKVIVERHGGKIWVESEPDKGSTFYFTTPKNSSI